MKFSILDQSPVSDSETAVEAFQHTTILAQQAETWGYARFWVSEHHGSTRVMGSAPEVLIAHLLAKTTQMRVGAGGVMLQHYSPYKVAENFNVLASLAPGRVDLGVGGGPGGLPRSTTALQQGLGPSPQPLGEKLTALQQFLHNQLDPHHPLQGLQASPLPPQPAEIFLLGTSPSSAVLAARLGVPYVFALFLNRDAGIMAEAVATYRQAFDPTRGTRPQIILALPVLVADTDAEARRDAADMNMVRIRLASGRTLTVGSVEAAEAFGKQAQEAYTLEVQEAEVIAGSLDTVRQTLEAIQRTHHADELMVVTSIRDFPKRLRSYELLSTCLSARE